MRPRLAWTAGFTITLVLLLGIGLVTYTQIARLANSAAAVERSYRVLEILRELETRLIDAETGQRGFLLTQDPTYLQPYDASSKRIRDLLQALHNQTAREAEMSGGVTQLTTLAEDKLDELHRTVTATEAGDPAGAVSIVKDGEGKRLMDQFRDTASSLMRLQERGLQLRRREEQRARIASQVVLIATIVLSLSLVGTGAIISRRFAERRQRLENEIAERAAAQVALARLKAAVESANDAIVITEGLLDLPGPRIEYVNPAFTRMTGYTAEEALGRTPRMLQGPNTDRGLLTRVRQDLLSQQNFHGETINYRKDGSEFAVEWRITPLLDAEGKVTHWVAIQRDATDRRRSEEYREAMLLSERVARTEAERATRLKDEFVATLSHELRTPLNAIVGWASILKRDHSPATIAQGVDVIERNARLQTQMVEDLLDMSRILSGKLRVELQKMDLPLVIDAAIASVKPTADAKGVRLESMLGSAGPINGDPGRIQQIVWNLLANAIKFTPRNGKVQIALRKIHSQIEISVSDTGQGIRPEFLPFVFDRFRQADASITRRHGGLGLGLSIVKNLVEVHGGTVDARSPGEGQGTTLTVRLPMALAHLHESGEVSPATATLLPEDVPDLHGLYILLVDDEVDARALARRVLEERGAQIISAGSVTEAIGAFVSERLPDVLVSDIGMPDQDGYDLIKHIRAMPGAASRVPAVALTALARSEDRRRALLSGFQTHLAKPVEPAELVAVIASLAGRTGRPRSA